MIKIYGSSLSPFVRKVLVFAAEKGIDVEQVRLGMSDPNPEFRAASPFGKIPAMTDGDYRLADSSAIIHYLESLHPEPAMIPTDPRERGKVIWFEEFADTMLYSCGARMFFNRVVSPRFLGRAGDEEVAMRAERDELPPLVNYLEGELRDGRDYLVGNRLTLADIAVACPFVNFRHMEIAMPTERAPNLSRYVEAILARPVFARLIDSETRFLAKVPA